jgi:hypothetical protein
MRSSEGCPALGFVRPHWALIVSILVATSLATACSRGTSATANGASADQASKPAPPVSCSATGVQGEGLAQARQTVESGPLFQAAAANTSLASCRATGAAEKVVIEYQFADGGSLRATRDPSIEYFDQEVRFASPPAASPVDLLTRTERAVFAADGCGIDWKDGQTQPSAGPSKETETVYRGETCNCQARIRSDASGRPLTLTFRSAC